MTQPNPFQPVITGVEQVEAAVASFSVRANRQSGFVDVVRSEMQNILTEARAGYREGPLHPMDQRIVQRLADALNELAQDLTVAQNGGPGTDVGPSQEHLLLGSVRSALRAFLTITRA